MEMVQFGILQILLSSLSLATMSFIIKDLKDIPASNLLFYRATIQIIVCLIFSGIFKINPIGKREIFGLLHLRGLFGGIAVLLYFFTLKQIEVSTATAIFMTTPVYTIFLSRIFLNDAITYEKCLAVTIVIFGSVLIAHPTSWSEKNSELIGSSLAMTEAFIAAIAVTTIKLIGDRAHYVQLVFYLSIYMFVIGLGLSIKDGIVLEVDYRILLIGLLASMGQLLVNSGLQKVSAVVGMTVRSSEVFFAFLIGIFVGENVTELSIYGSFMIIVGSWLIGRKSGKSEPRPTIPKAEENSDLESQPLKRKSFSNDL